MSAYACEPGRGSEAGAGWEWARAAARDHEVWVLTHATNEPSVSSALARDPGLAERLHPVFLRGPGWARALRRPGPSRFLYYLVWQLSTCTQAARRLHKQVGFDVAHHVTYAADWAPAGVGRLADVPFVWGPVGGSSSSGTPRLWLQLGARAALTEALRAVLLSAVRTTVGRRVAERADLVLGQNPDVAAALAPVPVLVQPNVALQPQDADGHGRMPEAGAAPRAVYAGRLLAWKGLRLAVDALRRPEAAAWQLDVYGKGPERERLEALVRQWGVADRVRFHGHRPRDEVLAALSSADVFLFPSLHDAAGWSVAEAAALGCPVVCLDLGGPPALLGPGDGVVVPAEGNVVAALAAALDHARGLRPEAERWSLARLPDVLADAYARATPSPPALVGSGS